MKSFNLLSIEQLIKPVFLAVTMSTILIACSDSNNSGASSAANEITATKNSYVVNGVSSKGPITGANINIFAMDADGNRTGQPLNASTITTDNNGNWTVDLGTPAPTQGLLIQSSGGSYIDEADPEPVFANKRRINLTALNIIEGVLPPGETTASVTIISNALLNKARDLAQTSSLNIMQALLSVKSVAQNAFGFDPFTVQAANPLSPPTTADAEAVLYGMSLGGVAIALNSAAITLGEPVPDFAMIEAMIKDLSDGKLDGEINGAAIPVAGLGRNFPSNINLNLSIERFRNNNFAAYSVTAIGNQIAVVDEVQLFSSPGVSAGSDQTVAGETTVNLAATSIAGSAAISSTSWTQISGTPVSLSDASQNTASFTSPVATAGTDQSLVFQVTVTDVNGNSASAQTTITVTADSINEAPVITSTAPTTATEDVLYTYLATATDADVGDTLSWVLSNPPTGMVVDSATGVVSWTPLAGVATSGAVTLTVSDGTDSASETFTIAVTLGSAPVGVDDSFTATEDTQLDIPKASLLQNDTDADAGTVLTVSTVTQPTHGTITQTATVIRYTPDANYFGTDSFRYVASDGVNNSTPVTVNITVTGVNDVPVAVNDSVSAVENTPLGINASTLLANDSDIEVGNAGLTIAGVTATSTQGGTVSQVASNLIYTPASNFVGTDTFTYTISDGGATATATVTVTVVEQNVAPVATNDTFSTTSEALVFIDYTALLSNDSDGNSDPLTITTISTPTNGGKIENMSTLGFVAYIPEGAVFISGTDSFTYTISDGQGGTDTGTVDITVNLDTDRDGVSDADEASATTDPQNPDSDGDGFSDGHELLRTPSTDPTLATGTGDFPTIPTTSVTGPITISSETVWTLDDSPVLIQNMVTIGSGGMLRIMPGVIIRFAAGASLIVDGGELIVIGNSPPPQHVLFTSSENNAIGGGANTAGPGDWTGLQFRSAASAEIHGATIEYAANAILFNVAGGGMVDNSIIRSSLDHAFTLDMTGDVDLRHNQIVNNGSSTTPQGGGIFVDPNMTGNLIIESNLIRGNKANLASGQGGGVFVSTTVSGTTSINNNLILENSADVRGGGVYLEGGNGLSFESNTITDNTIMTGPSIEGVGIYISSGITGSSQLLNNLIFFNDTGTDEIINNGSPVTDYNLMSNTATSPLTGTNDAVTATPEFFANWYLSQISAGQGTDSPALDAGSPTQPPVITDMTTRTDGGLDTGATDIGYHHPNAAPSIDAGTSDFQPANSPGIGLDTTVTVGFIPRDGNGVPVGPGLNVIVSFTSTPNGTINEIRDMGDGSYQFDFTSSGFTTSDTLQVSANGVTFTATTTISW